MLKIVLVSTSLSKLQTLINSLKLLKVTADIKCLAVDSGVSNHPIGSETARGALNRAVTAKDWLTKYRADWDLIVAIEGGYFQDDDEYFLQSYCAIVENKTNILRRGCSASLPITRAMFDCAQNDVSIRKLLDRKVKHGAVELPKRAEVYDVKDGKLTTYERVLEGKNEIIGLLSNHLLSRSQVDLTMLVNALLPFFASENYQLIDDMITGKS